MTLSFPLSLRFLRPSALPSLLATAACALLSMAPLAAHADATTDALKATLQTKLPGQATVTAVNKSPIPGLYEVTLGKQVIYSDPTGRYLVLGTIRDITTGEDLTQARLDTLNRIDFAKLPWKDAVKVVHGKGERKIAVFSDPNCPYCRSLEKTLQSAKNVTVYTFIYPILSEDSRVKAKSIWCSENASDAWENWMLKTIAPTASGKCDASALERNRAMGESFDVTGTPTVFLANGNRLPGAVSGDTLEKAMSDAQ